MAKALIWLLVFIVAAVSVSLIYVITQAATPDDTQIVSTRTILQRVHGSGKIEGMRDITSLQFASAGLLQNVMEDDGKGKLKEAPELEEGQEVEEGQSLAQLNCSDINDQIAKSEARLKEAGALLDLLTRPHLPSEIRNAEEKEIQANDDVAVLEIYLSTLTDPAPPHPAAHWEIEEATRTTGRAKNHLETVQANLKQLKIHPTDDELGIALANVDAARTELEGSEKLLADYKGAIGFLNAGKETKTQLEIKVDIARYNLKKVQAEHDRIKHGSLPPEIEAAQARVNLAQLELESAEAAKSRLEKPFAPTPAPEALTKDARIKLHQAQSRQRQARIDIEGLNSPVDPARILAAEAVKEQAAIEVSRLKKSREGLTLRAPFAGRIAKRHVEPGVLVAPFTPIFSLVDTRWRIRAEFDVVKLADIKTDMHVSISSRAIGKDNADRKDGLDGKVEKIIGVGTRKLSSDDPSAPKGGEVIEVIVTLDDKPASGLKQKAFDLLRLNMRVDVDVTIEKHDNVICVNKGFVSQKDGKDFVLKIEKNEAGKDETPKVQFVKRGLSNEVYVEIIDGLHPGDKIMRPQPVNTR